MHSVDHNLTLPPPPKVHSVDHIEVKDFESNNKPSNLKFYTVDYCQDGALEARVRYRDGARAEARVWVWVWVGGMGWG